jgi:hypothetical protein
VYISPLYFFILLVYNSPLYFFIFIVYVIFSHLCVGIPFVHLSPSIYMFHDIHRNDADLPSPFLWGKFSLLIGKKFWVYLFLFLGVVNFLSCVSGVLFWMIFIFSDRCFFC